MKKSLAFVLSLLSLVFLATTLSAQTGKPTISVYAPSNVASFPSGLTENNNFIIDYIRQRTGYDVQWSIQPKDNLADKMNVLMASGTAPDVVVLGSKDLFALYAQQGVLAPLDEPLKTVGAGVSKLIPAKTWKGVTFNKKIYAVPMPQNLEVQHGLLIRNDWLKKLKLKTPTTVDELYTVLKAFKAAKLGGEKTIPFVGGIDPSAPNALMNTLMGAFGASVIWDEQNGKIVNTTVTPGYKDYLTTLNKWYAEGLLDSEFPVNKKANIIEKLVNGRAGVASLAWADARDTVLNAQKNDPNAELIYIKPITGKNGLAGTAANPPIKTYLVVPAFSKKIKEAVDFISKYATDSSILEYYSYGKDGVHYNKVGGVITATPEQATIDWRVYYNIWDNQELFYYRKAARGFSPVYDPLLPWRSTQVDDIAGFAPPIGAVESVRSTLFDLTTDFTVKTVLGATPLTDFDAYVTKWKAAGGEKAQKALQDWYDSSK